MSDETRRDADDSQASIPTGLPATEGLEAPGAGGPGGSIDDAAEKQIGPYRLLEPLGEGGMGEVWLAEQTEPVRRQVALKVIKPGMDTEQVVARFEAERQALALMDHPAIAKVFDAGTTPRGPAVLRDGVRPGRADHRVLRRAQARPTASGSSCSCRSATACSTRTRRR